MSFLLVFSLLQCRISESSGFLESPLPRPATWEGHKRVWSGMSPPYLSGVSGEGRDLVCVSSWVSSLLQPASLGLSSPLRSVWPHQPQDIVLLITCHSGAAILPFLSENYWHKLLGNRHLLAVWGKTGKWVHGQDMPSKLDIGVPKIHTPPPTQKAIPWPHPSKTPPSFLPHFSVLDLLSGPLAVSFPRAPPPGSGAQYRKQKSL